MKLSSQIELITKKLKQHVDNYCENVITETGNEIERSARRNFNNALDEIPADDPIIRVYSMPTFKGSRGFQKTILCEGNQVLFTEFGVGVSHSTESSTIVMDNNKQIEYASRPAGIVGIGEYGLHRGKDDVWLYKSRNRRESLHSHFAKTNRKGEFIMITSGIRPVRALYRAVGTAFRKLGSGRLKIK